MRSAILGYGEVGSAFATLYREENLAEPVKVDPGLKLDGLIDSEVDVIHVCAPGRVVEGVCFVRPHDPLYVVHSTVPIGTCRRIADRGVRVVHAPVRGVHPHLAAGLRAFTMPVSGNPEDVRLACVALDRIGIRTEQWEPWESSELAKLCCTTELGLDVLWMRHVDELCNRFGARFDLVYTQWRKQYGDGYDVLGNWQYRRPVLKPMPGPIGGHCVTPNAEILAEHSAWALLVADGAGTNWKPQSVKPK